MNLTDDTAQLLAEQLSAQLDACAVKFFKAPAWIVKSKTLFKWYAKVKHCRIEIKEQSGQSKIYRFFKGGEKVGEIVIGQYKVNQGGENPLLAQIEKAFTEFIQSRQMFEAEPLTGWPMEATQEFREATKRQAWQDFKTFLQKHL